MSDNNGGTKLAYFLAGAGIGAILALLFAPKSGKETREYLTRKAEEGRDFVSSKSQQLREQAGDFVEKGKDQLGRAKDKLRAAYEAGVQTWQEEKPKSR